LEASRRAECVFKEQEQRIRDHEHSLELRSAALSNARDALSKTEATADQLRQKISEFGQESIVDFLRRRRLKALGRG